MSETEARLLIRIPTSLKVRLVELAKRERRSLNRQIEFLLETGLSAQEKDNPRPIAGQAAPVKRKQ
jgi:hypothetical protein